MGSLLQNRVSLRENLADKPYADPEKGANVVIIARDTSKLEQAKDDILKRRQSDNQHVESYSVDLGDATAVRFFSLFAIRTFFHQHRFPFIFVSCTTMSLLDNNFSRWMSLLSLVLKRQTFYFVLQEVPKRKMASLLTSRKTNSKHV